MVWCIGKRNVDSQLRIETVSIKYQIKMKKPERELLGDNATNGMQKIQNDSSNTLAIATIITNAPRH